MVCTVVAPCFTTTVTVAESPAALPAVPVIDGEALVAELPLVGVETAKPDGATVSTVNETTDDVVEFPAASDCVAVTV